MFNDVISGLLKYIYGTFQHYTSMHTCIDQNRIAGLSYNTEDIILLQSGYTILREVWSCDDTLEGGDWQLRLVGSTPHLPTRKNTTSVAPTGDELPTAITITPSLHTHEVINYCRPNKDKKLVSSLVYIVVWRVFLVCNWGLLVL